MVTEKRHIGTRGEDIARAYLERAGLKFVAANWSCKAGEVDLLMRHRFTLVFVEVRLRAPTVFGEGFETVGRDKQRKLIRTAQYYQQKENYWGDIRFDVISIVAREDGEFEIDHIAHAFDSPQ